MARDEATEKLGQSRVVRLLANSRLQRSALRAAAEPHPSRLARPGESNTPTCRFEACRQQAAQAMYGSMSSGGRRAPRNRHSGRAPLPSKRGAGRLSMELDTFTARWLLVGLFGPLIAVFVLRVRVGDFAIMAIVATTTAGLQFLHAHTGPPHHAKQEPWFGLLVALLWVVVWGLPFLGLWAGLLGALVMRAVRRERTKWPWGRLPFALATVGLGMAVGGLFLMAVFGFMRSLHGGSSFYDVRHTFRLGAVPGALCGGAGVVLTSKGPWHRVEDASRPFVRDVSVAAVACAVVALLAWGYWEWLWWHWLKLKWTIAGITLPDDRDRNRDLGSDTSRRQTPGKPPGSNERRLVAMWPALVAHTRGTVRAQSDVSEIPGPLKCPSRLARPG